MLRSARVPFAFLRFSSTDAQRRENIVAANRITLVGVGVNLGAAAIKGTVGWWVSSPVLLADAGHSLSDLLSDGITLFTINNARHPPDERTPWGYGRVESVGSAACSAFIVATGLGLGLHSGAELAHMWLNDVDPAALGAEEGAIGVAGAVGAAVSGILCKVWAPAAPSRPVRRSSFARGLRGFPGMALPGDAAHR